MATIYVDENKQQHPLGNVIDSLPIGSIVLWPSSTIPSGYKICNGDTLLKADYPDLFSVLNYTYGGSGNSFNLPDYRGRTPVGVTDGTGTVVATFTLANTGGEVTHTLTTQEMPSHAHTIPIGSFVNSDEQTDTQKNGHISKTIPQGINYSSNNAGGGQAHNNMQPYIVQNYIIKVSYSVAAIGGGGGGDTLPIGAIVPFGGTTIPNGYLECNGEVYSIDDYPDLYTAIGLTWVNSSSHGASTGYFCVPDLGGRVPVGQTDELSALNYDGTYVMGGYGGNEKHTHTIKIGHATWYGVPMSENNLGLYIMDESGNRSSTSSAGGRLPTANRSRNSALTTSMTTLSHDGFATETQGTSYSQYTMQPYLVTKYIIKAFNVKAISNRAEVINNLSSSSITDALSAAMGAQLYGETLFTGDTTSSSISINKSISLFHRIKIYGYVVHNSEPNNKSLNFGQEFLVSGNNDRYCISGLSYAGSTYMYMFGCVLTISGTSVTRGTNVKIYSTQPDTDDNIVLHITEIRGFYS